MSTEEGYLASLHTSTIQHQPHQQYAYPYSINDLTKARVIQKTVVYVIGLSSFLANKEILMREEYFGQYGPIVKIVVNRNGYAQNSQSKMTYSAFATFSSPKDASLALLAIDNSEIDGHVIRCSFGTTKYCSFFLKSMECSNKECLYLHSLAEDEDTLLKEDSCSYSNKMIFLQQQRIAVRIANIQHKDFYNNKPKNNPKLSSGFPSIDTLYYKDYLGDCYSNSNYNSDKQMRKYSEYDTSSKYYNRKYNYEGERGRDKDNTYNNNEEEEEMEYVLVKEPCSKRRKWKTKETFQSTTKKETKKRKRNMTLEDIKLPKQQDEIFSSASSASTSTCNSNKQIINAALIPKQSSSLFNTAVKSRFDFVNEGTNDQSRSPLDIPEPILKILHKNTSSLSFFKQFTSNDVYISIEDSNQITSWNEVNCNLNIIN